MTNRSDALLERLYEEGAAHDEETADHSRRMLNITPGTGEFLDLLITQLQPPRVLELGTSNGYSTIWLGRAAARFGGKVVSVEYLPSKVALAAKNLSDAELSGTVDLKMININKFLKSAEADSFDFVFLDTDRGRYPFWWNDIKRVLNFGTLVIDNATSHPDEMQPLLDLLKSDLSYDRELFKIGKGQLVVRQKNDPFSEDLRTSIAKCK